MKAESAIYTAFDDTAGFDTALAEKNLMRAVLRTAMEDVGKSGELQRAARNYLLSEDESYLFAFKSICTQLNLCHRTIRVCLGLIDPGNRVAKREQAAA